MITIPAPKKFLGSAAIPLRQDPKKKRRTMRLARIDRARRRLFRLRKCTLFATLQSVTRGLQLRDSRIQQLGCALIELRANLNGRQFLTLLLYQYDGRPCHQSELILSAWQIEPERYGLTGRTDYPCSSKVLTKLVDAVRYGWAQRTQECTYVISRKGRLMIEQLFKQLQERTK
ncbi:MAG: hypothetical protein E6Q97_01600 [Desulfurellales bacterium]|nr:MAG: hypothetical protein E6Q97_01600 [Desulfurellales bacterium]